MIWVAPSEKDTANDALEKRLWDAADQFRTNSGRKPQEYSAPVLGLIPITCPLSPACVAL
jgi:type I restriction enzyme M protein